MEQLNDEYFDKILNGNSNKKNSILENIILEGDRRDLSYNWAQDFKHLYVSVMGSIKNTLFKISLKNNSVGYYYEECIGNNTSCGILIECNEVTNFNIINIDIYRLYIVKKSKGSTYKSHNFGEAEKYIRTAFNKYILNNTHKLLKSNPLRKRDTLNIFFNSNCGTFTDSEVIKYAEYFNKTKNQRFRLSK